MRRYPIHSACNFRDIGGYPTKNGKYIKFDKLFRSDCPKHLDEHDLEQLEALGIEHVIDLRSLRERQKHESPFKKLNRSYYHHFGFSTGDLAPKSEAHVPHGYLEMLEDEQTILASLNVIAGAEGAVIYHCAVGKDRTGVMTMLIMALCGAYEQDIIADYQISHTYLKQLIDVYQKTHPQMPYWVGLSKSEYMRETMSLIQDKYGSFHAYTEAMHIDHNLIEAIKDRLLISK